VRRRNRNQFTLFPNVTPKYAAMASPKVVLTAHVVFSADGKSRTVTTKGTDAQGKKYESTAVYDKQ
jgi:hypothetical protein